jgi:hypothetical protein
MPGISVKYANRSFLPSFVFGAILNTEDGIYISLKNVSCKAEYWTIKLRLGGYFPVPLSLLYNS